MSSRPEYPFGGGVRTRGRVVEVRPEPILGAEYTGADYKPSRGFFRWLLRLFLGR